MKPLHKVTPFWVALAYLALLLFFATSMLFSQVPIKGIDVADSGGFRCDGQQKFINYFPSEKLWVRKSIVWMGMSRGAIADFWFYLSRGSDDSTLGHTNWDHYAEPTAPHDKEFNYSPDWIILDVGDRLDVRYGCTSLDGGTTHDGHIVVTLFVREVEQ